MPGELGLWVDLRVITKAGDDEQADRFSPGAAMVSSVGVNSGQQMSQAYLNPPTDFGPTRSPFVRQLGKVLLDPVLVTVSAEPVDSVRIAQEPIARATPKTRVDIGFIVYKPAAFIDMPSGLENPASLAGVVQRLFDS
jgi:hypothetical protein